MTRQQYRQQSNDFGSSLGNEENGGQRQPFSESRAAQRNEQEQLSSEEKSQRLKRKLNIAIVGFCNYYRVFNFIFCKVRNE